jgi:hypothetical protein
VVCGQDDRRVKGDVYLDLFAARRPLATGIDADAGDYGVGDRKVRVHQTRDEAQRSQAPVTGGIVDFDIRRRVHPCGHVPRRRIGGVLGEHVIDLDLDVADVRQWRIRGDQRGDRGPGDDRALGQDEVIGRLGVGLPRAGGLGQRPE